VRKKLLIGLVFALFFFLPVGWAKHWLIAGSLVNGVLVDYLMPDFWFQDLLALLVVLLASYRVGELSRWRINFKMLFGFLLIAISIFRSSIPLVSLVYAARFFLALLTALSLRVIFQKEPKLVKTAYLGLAGAVVWTNLLAISQLVNQGTVLGWWFLGEPIFSLGSGGVKKVRIFGRVFVTPIATFPHSNVLAGFALISALIFASRRKRNRLEQLALILSLFSLLFSFSLFTWLIALLIFLWHYWPILIPIFYILYSIFYSSPSLFRRLALIKLAFRIMAAQPLWGVGWGCFVKKLPDYWQQLSLTDRFLQPVHNIFLIVISELGLLGSLGLLVILGKLYKKLLVNIPSIPYTLYSMLFLGLFDHYFWTTTQGVYMLFLLPVLANSLKTKTRAG